MTWISQQMKYKRMTIRPSWAFLQMGLRIKTTSSQLMTFSLRMSVLHILRTLALKQRFLTTSSPNFSRWSNLEIPKTIMIGLISIQIAAMTIWTFMITRLSKHPYLRMNYRWLTVDNRLPDSHVQLTKDSIWHRNWDTIEKGIAWLQALPIETVMS